MKRSMSFTIVVVAVAVLLAPGCKKEPQSAAPSAEETHEHGLGADHAHDPAMDPDHGDDHAAHPEDMEVNEHDHDHDEGHDHEH